MDLKELLKNLEEDTEKSVWQRRDRFTKTELAAYLEGKKIHHQKFVLLLGEWAFNKRQGAIEVQSDWLWDITVACLGEKEVKKRLSECEDSDKR